MNDRNMKSAGMPITMEKPAKKFEPVHPGITDDKFVILVETEQNEKSTRETLQSMLSGVSNVEIV